MSVTVNVVDDFGCLVVPAPRARLVLAPSVYSPAGVITAVAPNPKKAGTVAYDNYAKYAVGMSVAAYTKAVGAKGALCVRYDLARGYISLGSPS